MAGFFAVLILVTNISENLSINTGFPFGWFTHQPALGPKIFDVPVLVNFGYLAIGYVSICVADLILGKLPPGHKYFEAISIAAIAGFIAAGWNASLDPLGSTLQKSWLWRDGGGYFGVPITNTMGWLMTMIIAAALGIPILKRGARAVARNGTVIWLYQPPAVLIVQSALLIIGWYQSPEGRITDPTGQNWPIAALMETTALVSIVTCCAFGTIGLLRACKPSLLDKNEAS